MFRAGLCFTSVFASDVLVENDDLSLLQVNAKPHHNHEFVGGMISRRFDEDMDATLCSDGGISMDDATVLHSNLGGQGPDSGAESMLVGPVAPGINLEITATSDYTPNTINPRGGVLNNKIHDKFIQINVATNAAVDLNFQLVDSTTGQPTTMDKFAFTMVDRDQGMSHESRESITVHGFSSFKAGTDVAVVEQGDTAATFSSTLRGGNVDNPTSPHSLSGLAERRSAVLLFSDAGAFTMKIEESDYANPQGRNLLFAGRSGLLCEEKASCIDAKCPSGMALKLDAEFLECSSKPCGESDVALCCRMK